MSRLTTKILALSLCIGAATVAAQPAVYRLPDLQKRISQPDTLYVVNFWATWCKPCVKELPAFDSLQVLHQSEAVKVLLVSLDFADQLESRVIPFIRRRGVECEVVLLDESDGNVFINAIHPEWSGAIPATLLRKGNYSALSEGELTLPKLEALVQKAYQ